MIATRPKLGAKRANFEIPKLQHLRLRQPFFEEYQ